MTYPEPIARAIETWLAANAVGGRRDATAALSQTFRYGGSSRGVDLAAYLTMRAPATFAAVTKCLEELLRRDDVAPQSLLDLGAGPGTASWAALAAFPELSDITMVDHHKQFLDIGQILSKESGHAALSKATFLQGTLQSVALPKADLVTMSYALAEIAETDVASIIFKAWGATAQTLVVIEPGTPHGFKRIKLAREALLKAKATIIAPCSHQAPCPLSQDDWCHFEVRLQRSRAHMHAKSGTLPYEDEPYSYLIASRQAASPLGARIIRPVLASKHDLTFKLCSAEGVTTQSYPTRDKVTFKRVKKLDWGDHLEADHLADVSAAVLGSES